MRSPSMIRQAIFASGTPIALETNGTVRDARGLASMMYRLAVVDGVLDVDEPERAERERDPARRRADLLEHLRAERVRRQHAGAVAGVDAGLLDVLHDAADPDGLAVAQRVDVELDRVLQEAVEEDLARRGAGRRRRAARCAEVVGEAVLVVDDLHRAAAEHVARAHEQREADAARWRRAPPATPCAVAYGGAL